MLPPGSQSPVTSQQPSGHVKPLHDGGRQVPALQLSPEGHDVHALPPVPHAVGLVPVSQKPNASQQPVGHEAALQTGPLQAPAEQESSGGHGKHALPPVPHAVVLVPDSHFPKPSQQPVGHVVALQPAPWHAPLMHPSPGGQATHAFPPLPHEMVLFPSSQTPAVSQQPVGHVEALQGGGRHVPALQLSPGGHAEHPPPPFPQAPVLVPVSQKPRASQQPVGHEAALQTGPMQDPAEHESRGGHGKHALPPVPHAVWLVPDSHFPELSQHPFGHVEALQVAPRHAPPAHVSPAGQAAQATPSLPQAVVLSPDSQVPETSQHPVGHVDALQGGATQVWVVALHTKPRPAQSWHELPPPPQAMSSAPPTHLSPPLPFGSQQPLGHVLGVHPTVTPTQAWDPGSHPVKPSAVQSSHACAPSPQAVGTVPL